MERFPEGLGNRNFLVTTHSGQFVIKEALFHTAEEVEIEMVYLARLAEHRFPAPSCLQGMNGEKIFRKAGHVLRAQNKFGGEHPEPTPQVCAVLGKWLAKLHKIPCGGLPPRNHWMAPEFLPGYMELLLNSELPYKDQARESYERLRTLDFNSMPQAIVHNDIYRGNLLFDGLDLIAMLDWEETVAGAAILDVASAIVYFCLDEGRIVDRNLGALLDGYSAHRTLQKSELASLGRATQYVSLTNSIWLMVQFGIETPDDYQRRRGEQYWRFSLDNLALPGI